MSDNEHTANDSFAPANNTNTSTDSDTGTSQFSYIGRVKWFNNRAGYGFATILNGDKSGTDIFAHHSGVSVDHEQYRYLVQGEYISFKISNSNSKNHKWQATNVRGIMGGKLMCETHWEMRKERDERSKTADNEQGYQDRSKKHNNKPRRYGHGPREDSEGFTLAKGRRHKSEDISME